jgi:transporter family-2 protein
LGILAGVLKLGLFGMEKFEFHYLDLLGIALLAVGARILLID